jgi:hypothetical protein
MAVRLQDAESPPQDNAASPGYFNLMRNVFVAATFALAGSLLLAAPSHAAVCDLTSAGSTCSSFGAIYTNVLPTGTFYIDPFLQMKNTGSEQGYNTNGDTNPSKGGTQYQFNQSGETRALSTSELTPTLVGSTNYYQFMLNIDEPGSDPKLTLDQLQIFLSPSATLTSYDSGTRTLGGLTAIYDLDSGGDNSINLNYSLQTGRTGTMIFYVPTSLFTQPGYIYLYSQFGATGYTAGAGLEEWWIRTNNTSDTSITRVANPEPGTLVLVGSALALGVRRMRRRKLTQI